jgi:hypothetical protein
MVPGRFPGYQVLRELVGLEHDPLKVVRKTVELLE